MGEWWAAKSGFEQLFWYCALPASVILLIQMALTFMGMSGDEIGDAGDMDGVGDGDIGDMDGDADVETDGGGVFPFFTFRNFVAFFTMFGWTGVMMVNNGYGTLSTIMAAVGAGLVMMAMISLLYYSMSKMTSSGGTYNLKQALGMEGTVYIKVPKGRAGSGRINVEINNQVRELDAITESPEDLVSGTVVRISKITNNKLVVERV